MKNGKLYECQNTGSKILVLFYTFAYVTTGKIGYNFSKKIH